jgi:HAD superfamily hydrolase (TIGR01509 family)
MLFIFDMAGVVANSTCTENICARLGISMQDFYMFQLDPEGNNTYQQLSIGSISPKEYWENFSYNSGIEVHEDLFKVLYRPEIDNSLIILIKELKKIGSRVVCCTNTIESHFEEHLRLGNYSIFDFVYSSHLMGVKKPNPEIFKRIIDLERALAEDVYFIDDDERNVEVAQDIGVTAHLFISAEKLKKALSQFFL